MKAAMTLCKTQMPAERVDPRIHTPPGTRCNIIVRKPNGWEVWTATDGRAGDSAHWRGTYLFLADDGTASAHTRLSDEEKEYRIF